MQNSLSLALAAFALLAALSQNVKTVFYTRRYAHRTAAERALLVAILFGVDVLVVGGDFVLFSGYPPILAGILITYLAGCYVFYHRRAQAAGASAAG